MGANIPYFKKNRSFREKFTLAELFQQPAYILAVLAFVIVLCEILTKYTWLKQVGTALLAIVITAIIANLGLIPSASDAPPLYKGIFTYLAPLSIFYLLLEVSLRHLKLAGIPMLVMFGIGAAGTTLGVMLGMWAIQAISPNGLDVLGDQTAALAGMFTGTYIGGSVNFNAIALHYNVMEEGILFAGAAAVDNILTALWMVATIALPKLLETRFPRKETIRSTFSLPGPGAQEQQEEETLSPFQLSLLIFLGVFMMWLSDALQSLTGQWGFEIPSIILLTTFALLLAQVPYIQRLPGKRLLGLYAVYLFLAVIGAYCELAAMREIGTIALYLVLLVSIIVITHAVVTYGLGFFLKYDWDIISVASQANIGGSSTALALAKTLSRTELMLPGILIGSLGNGVGTYMGFLVAAWFS